MKNLVKNYISKSQPHLFTQDGKTFLKIMLNGERAYCLYLKKGKILLETISLLGRYQLTSSAGKDYLDPALKYRIFSRYGGKYRAVKAPRRLKDVLLGMEQMLDKDSEADFQLNEAFNEILEGFIEKEI